MISPSQRPLPDNKQHSQQTNIHVPDGIRTHNLSKRAAKDLRLRPEKSFCLVFFSRDSLKKIIKKIYYEAVFFHRRPIIRIFFRIPKMDVTFHSSDFAFIPCLKYKLKQKSAGHDQFTSSGKMAKKYTLRFFR